MASRLSDVARKAGTSPATVSRVLNDRPGVSEAKRQAVLTALDVLGYERPSSLRGDRPRFVGLVMPELQNPIFPALAELIGGTLTQNGFSPLLNTQNTGGMTDSDFVELLLEQQVSGVIYLAGVNPDGAAARPHFIRLQESGLPTVVINGTVDALPFPTVSTDDVAAAEQAVTHLHQLGHRRIGLLMGGRGHLPSQRKVFGAQRKLAELDCEVDDALVVRGMYSIEAGQAGAAKLLGVGATAIVCASDMLALGAIWAARRAGLRVPEDVSVVGYDDSQLMSFIDPPLTTVRQPIDAMGRAAFDLLMAQIEGTDEPVGELLFEPEFVLRSSTGPVRA
ncbi:LacI family DNA-binding transcriptional regulator [Agromyces sp. NPDC058110]|uniref:LacI family DNA-binding transcriptional regulator n=1 Tax=Agromyces sp. NPDC058110 TaxID=3346345 RepID=UPI0036D8522E